MKRKLLLFCVLAFLVSGCCQKSNDPQIVINLDSKSDKKPAGSEPVSSGVRSENPNPPARVVPAKPAGNPVNPAGTDTTGQSPEAGYRKPADIQLLEFEEPVDQLAGEHRDEALKVLKYYNDKLIEESRHIEKNHWDEFEMNENFIRQESQKCIRHESENQALERDRILKEDMEICTRDMKASGAPQEEIDRKISHMKQQAEEDKKFELEKIEKIHARDSQKNIDTSRREMLRNVKKELEEIRIHIARDFINEMNDLKEKYRNKDR